MKQVYLLNISSNKEEFEQEEKNKFLKTILEVLEFKTDSLFEENTVENKIKIKNLLSKNNLKIADEDDYIVFFENQEIARMKKPFYKIKKDLSELDRKNQVYIEVTVEYETKLL